jgi:hypothetical protein
MVMQQFNEDVMRIGNYYYNIFQTPKPKGRTITYDELANYITEFDDLMSLEEREQKQGQWSNNETH